jgi:hypothetical protein
MTSWPRDDGSVRHSERASINQILAKESYTEEIASDGLIRMPRDDGASGRDRFGREIIRMPRDDVLASR